MVSIFDGKTVSEKILAGVSNKLSSLKMLPSLAILKTGNIPSQTKFTRRKQKIAHRLGIECDIIKHNFDVSENLLCRSIDELSYDYDGILIQLPLPDFIDKFKILDSIPYEKDVEGLCSQRAAKLFQRVPEIYSPVAMAVIQALKDAEFKNVLKIKGSHTVIIGNSYLVGMPVSQILYKMGSTITLCGSQTKNLKKYSKKADILVTATGKKHIIKTDMVKPGCVVIDAGFDLDKKGKIFGDCDPGIKEIAGFFTPVPGGIGPLTIANIFNNLINL